MNHDTPTLARKNVSARRGVPEVQVTLGSILIKDHVSMGRIDALETGAFALVGNGVCVVCRSGCGRLRPAASG